MVGLLFNGIEKKMFLYFCMCVCVFGFFLYFRLHLLNSRSDNRKFMKIKKIKMKNELC